MLHVCSASAHLRGLEGDLHAHGATNARQLAGQSLLGLMGHLRDVFNGQVELRKRGILIMVNLYAPVAEWVLVECVIGPIE